MIHWLLCIGLSALVASAQQAGDAAARAVETGNRITLDVVVNDRSGTPVSGLQQQDFSVLDNKQPQTILAFRAGGPSESAVEQEIVLIIDSVNTAFERVAYERREVAKFLQQDQGKLAQPTSIGILSDSGLFLQESPSRDGNAVLTFLDQHQTALRLSRRSQGFYGAEDRARLSLNALAQLANVEQKRPGRKLVVWISPGWAFLSGPGVQLSSKEQQNIFNTIVAVSTELWASRITLYSVDPLGMADAGGPGISYYESFLKAVSLPKQTNFGDLGLQVLARQSGGRVLNSSNDIAEEIERCVRDANGYYVLSFDARPADGPNEYHAIEVKMATPGMKAQTRFGYYAQPIR